MRSLPEIFIFFLTSSRRAEAKGESKAQARVSFIESGSKQFRAYVNRFGSGMVIYWHGVVEELREVDSNVLLVDAFPERKDIVMLARFEEDGENEDF